MPSLLKINNKKHLIIIGLAGIAVYINSLINNFVWDDVFIIINNDFIKGVKLIKEIFLKPTFYFAYSDYVYYRPLQSLSNMLDYHIWGLNPFGFHLTNLLLHICAAILVYFFINILCGDREVSFFTGLLFTVHPINTSVVNYITSRADILLTIFTVSSAIFFLKAKSSKAYILSLICFILALLSKETAVIFPLCLIFVRVMHAQIRHEAVGSKISRDLFWYISFVIAVILYFLLRVEVIGVGANMLVPSETGFFSFLLTFSRITLNYLKLIYLPFNLHMLRNVDIVVLRGDFAVLYIIFAVLVILALMATYRLNKIVFFSLGFFLLWLIPVGFIALKSPEYYFQHKAIMEEHWLYLPSIGIFLGTVYIIKRFVKNAGGLFYKGTLAAFIISLSIITLAENKYWKNNYTLFSHTLKYVDNSITFYRNLGRVYLSRQEMNKSIDMYKKALGIKQDKKQRLVLYKDLAYAYFLNNKIKEAVDFCLKSLNINYNYAPAHACLGLIYSKDDSKKEICIKEWKIALEFDPFNTAAFNNLLKLSKTDNNIRSYLTEKYNSLLKEYKHFQRYRVYTALGLIYLYNGMNPEAIFNIKNASKINPYDVKLNNALAVYYAQLKDFNRAIRFFEIALKLNPFDKETYENFAALYTQLNETEKANMLIEKSRSVNIFD